MTALRLQAGQLDVSDCAFVQMRPAPLARAQDMATSDGGWLASVAAEGGAGPVPGLHCTGCCFLFQDQGMPRLGGQASQAAVRLSGAVKAEFDNCASAHTLPSSISPTKRTRPP